MNNQLDLLQIRDSINKHGATDELKHLVGEQNIDLLFDGVLSLENVNTSIFDTIIGPYSKYPEYRPVKQEEIKIFYQHICTILEKGISPSITTKLENTLPITVLYELVSGLVNLVEDVRAFNAARKTTGTASCAFLDKLQMYGLRVNKRGSEQFAYTIKPDTDDPSDIFDIKNKRKASGTLVELGYDQLSLFYDICGDLKSLIEEIPFGFAVMKESSYTFTIEDWENTSVLAAISSLNDDVRVARIGSNKASTFEVFDHARNDPEYGIAWSHPRYIVDAIYYHVFFNRLHKLTRAFDYVLVSTVDKVADVEQFQSMRQQSHGEFATSILNVNIPSLAEANTVLTAEDNLQVLERTNASFADDGFLEMDVSAFKDTTYLKVTKGYMTELADDVCKLKALSNLAGDQPMSKTIFKQAFEQFGFTHVQLTDDFGLKLKNKPVILKQTITQINHKDHLDLDIMNRANEITFTNAEFGIMSSAVESNIYLDKFLVDAFSICKYAYTIDTHNMKVLRSTFGLESVHIDEITYALDQVISDTDHGATHQVIDLVNEPVTPISDKLAEVSEGVITGETNILELPNPPTDCWMNHVLEDNTAHQELYLLVSKFAKLNDLLDKGGNLSDVDITAGFGTWLADNSLKRHQIKLTNEKVEFTLRDVVTKPYAFDNGSVEEYLAQLGQVRYGHNAMGTLITKATTLVDRVTVLRPLVVACINTLGEGWKVRVDGVQTALTQIEKACGYKLFDNISAKDFNETIPRVSTKTKIPAIISNESTSVIVDEDVMLAEITQGIYISNEMGPVAAGVLSAIVTAAFTTAMVAPFYYIAHKLQQKFDKSIVGQFNQLPSSTYSLAKPTERDMLPRIYALFRNWPDEFKSKVVDSNGHYTPEFYDKYKDIMVGGFADPKLIVNLSNDCDLYMQAILSIGKQEVLDVDSYELILKKYKQLGGGNYLKLHVDPYDHVIAPIGNFKYNIDNVSLLDIEFLSHKTYTFDGKLSKELYDLDQNLDLESLLVLPYNLKQSFANIEIINKYRLLMLASIHAGKDLNGLQRYTKRFPKDDILALKHHASISNVYIDAMLEGRRLGGNESLIVMVIPVSVYVLGMSMALAWLGGKTIFQFAKLISRSVVFCYKKINSLLTKEDLDDVDMRRRKAIIKDQKNDLKMKHHFENTMVRIEQDLANTSEFSDLFTDETRTKFTPNFIKIMKSHQYLDFKDPIWINEVIAEYKGMVHVYDEVAVSLGLTHKHVDCGIFYEEFLATYSRKVKPKHLTFEYSGDKLILSPKLKPETKLASLADLNNLTDFSTTYINPTAFTNLDAIEDTPTFITKIPGIASILATSLPVIETVQNIYGTKLMCLAAAISEYYGEDIWDIKLFNNLDDPFGTPKRIKEAIEITIERDKEFYNIKN